MKSVLPVKEVHEFRKDDLIGGHPALDFVNTVTGRDGNARDWLVNASGLVRWATAAGVVTQQEGRELHKLVSADRAGAEAAFARAIGLREAIYSLLDAVAGGKAPPEASIGPIEAAWRAAASSSRLLWAGPDGLNVGVRAEGLDVIAGRLAASFVELGPRLSSDRLRKCVGRNCAWFFLDTSKGGRRRWCDMAACGNAAKYARAKAVGRTADKRVQDRR